MMVLPWARIVGMRWKVEDTPEQAAFREEFRAWLRQTLEPGWTDAIEAEDDDAYAAARQRAEANGWNPFSWTAVIGRSGYAAPLWPKEYGGLSAEPWAQGIVREELNQYRLPTVSLNILGLGLAGPTIVEHGTEAQKARYLQQDPHRRGGVVPAVQRARCGLRSVAGLGTRAVQDGDEWVVNGQKVWTSIAQFSQWGMLLARTDPDEPKHEGLTYFICRHEGRGVDIRPLRQTHGQRRVQRGVLHRRPHPRRSSRSAPSATGGASPAPRS